MATRWTEPHGEGNPNGFPRGSITRSQGEAHLVQTGGNMQFWWGNQPARHRKTVSMTEFNNAGIEAVGHIWDGNLRRQGIDSDFSTTKWKADQAAQQAEDAKGYEIAAIRAAGQSQDGGLRQDQIDEMVSIAGTNTNLQNQVGVAEVGGGGVLGENSTRLDNEEKAAIADAQAAADLAKKEASPEHRLKVLTEALDRRGENPSSAELTRLMASLDKHGITNEQIAAVGNGHVLTEALKNNLTGIQALDAGLSPTEAKNFADSGEAIENLETFIGHAIGDIAGVTQEDRTGTDTITGQALIQPLDTDKERDDGEGDNTEGIRQFLSKNNKSGQAGVIAKNNFLNELRERPSNLIDGKLTLEQAESLPIDFFFDLENDEFGTTEALAGGWNDVVDLLKAGDYDYLGESFLSSFESIAAGEPYDVVLTDANGEEFTLTVNSDGSIKGQDDFDSSSNISDIIENMGGSNTNTNGDPGGDGLSTTTTTTTTTTGDSTTGGSFNIGADIDSSASINALLSALDPNSDDNRNKEFLNADFNAPDRTALNNQNSNINTLISELKNLREGISPGTQTTPFPINALGNQGVGGQGGTGAAGGTGAFPNGTLPGPSYDPSTGIGNARTVGDTNVLDTSLTFEQTTDPTTNIQNLIGELTNVANNKDPRFQDYRDSFFNEEVDPNTGLKGTGLFDTQRRDIQDSTNSFFNRRGIGGSSGALNAIANINTEFNQQERAFSADLGLKELGRQDKALLDLSGLNQTLQGINTQNINTSAGLIGQEASLGQVPVTNNLTFDQADNVVTGQKLDALSAGLTNLTVPETLNISKTAALTGGVGEQLAGLQTSVSDLEELIARLNKNNPDPHNFEDNTYDG